jgi:hypothetical protein
VTLLERVTEPSDVGAGILLQDEYWTPLGRFADLPIGDGTTYSCAAAVADRDVEALRPCWTTVRPVQPEPSRSPRARRRTLSSIPSVKRPVFVFCWLTW